jgi:hypothetical protein
MRRLRIGILDLATNAPIRNLYGRLMNANLASIMPQAVGAWCEQDGHAVWFACYSGSENALRALPQPLDLLFIGAFTQAAQLAYALGNLFRRRGTVVALGGPHARCYPDDARKYFDYVLGLTDKTIILEVLRDCSPHRPRGAYLSAPRQPDELPGVAERWKFIEPTLARAPLVKLVPMLSSVGCPYTCNFCIDSVVPYHPFRSAQIVDDLRFLLRKLRRPQVAWHDPNFGVRFDDIMAAIEEAAPPGRMQFGAESSLSLLSESHVARMGKAGFKALLPGVESWFAHGDKSKTGRLSGLEKVHQISEHAKLILRSVPYLQTNFVLGLDSDEGPLPFELTKRFIDLTPGAFPGYSLLTAYGRAAPQNLEFQRDGRLLPFPFHVLNNNHAMNVRPRHYGWPEFYDRVIDLTRHSFSWRTVARRFGAARSALPRWMNFVRAVSSEGRGRLHYYRTVRRLLDTDRSVRRFFEGETTQVPAFYVDRIRRDLGPLWDLLPAGALAAEPELRLETSSAPIAGKRGPSPPEGRDLSLTPSPADQRS